MNERKIVFADGSDIFVVDIEHVNVKTRLVASDSPITGKNDFKCILLL
jgi:hypothetical protein